MQEFVFLKSLVIVLGISAFVVFILHRIKIPSIVGFLLAGMLLGPHGLHIIRDTETIQVLAEIGVILLLFTIGLEFSLSRFLKMRFEVFGIGGLQVLITILLTAFSAYVWFGIADYNTAIFIGFMVSLSSTAIVMKLISDRAEVDAPHGRITIGMLIFQDLCVVPFMLFIPILSGGAGLTRITFAIGEAVAIIIIVLFSARWLVPNILHRIVHTKSRELFVITILIICFGIAFLTSEFGLSLALGAFLAGLVISESEYSQEATSTILPFRDGFSGLFFISMGMLLNMSFLVDNLYFIVMLSGGIIAFKILSGFVPMYLLGRPLRTSIQSSLNIAQVGEFSFILALAGLSAGLITDDIYQNFLSAAVLTMLITPLLMQFSPLIAARLSSLNLLKRLERIKSLSEDGEYPRKLRDHIVIVGFGFNGRNLARVLREVKIPYVVLELNIDTVLHMKKQGENIFYGDGTKTHVLKSLRIKMAKGLVVAISDPPSCRSIVSTARRLNPELFIIARTRYIVEVDDLLELGADEVIPEEFETSVEIFSRVLARYQIPRNEISNFIDIIREDGYKALRHTDQSVLSPLFSGSRALSKVDVELYAITENSPALGRSIEEMKFRTLTGATIIAIERSKSMHTSPDPKSVFEAGDIVFITGTRKDINRALLYLAEGKTKT
jgi:CPA2 family monovalent cation:H+ antiporter-2